MRKTRTLTTTTTNIATRFIIIIVVVVIIIIHQQCQPEENLLVWCFQQPAPSLDGQRAAAASQAPGILVLLTTRRFQQDKNEDRYHDDGGQRHQKQQQHYQHHDRRRRILMKIEAADGGYDDGGYDDDLWRSISSRSSGSTGGGDFEDEDAPADETSASIFFHRDEKDKKKQLSSDWMESELTLRTLPTLPARELSSDVVVLTCCRSLQWVDQPESNAGLKRCYNFMTYECRKVITARQGGESIERFCHYGLLSPALQPFMGAYRIDIGTATYTKAQPPNRGALMSYPIKITMAPIHTLQYPSGMIRQGVPSETPTRDFIIRLEQQRRPPNQYCWLIREVLDVRQVFAGDMGNAHVGG